MIKNIKKHNHIIKIIIIVFTIISIITLIYIKYPRMNNLPQGVFLKELVSPNGKYTLNAYLYDGNHPTVYPSLRVEVVNNENGNLKNIYWKYGDVDVNMEWIDNDNVTINYIVLNIHHDIYDYRLD